MMTSANGQYYQKQRGISLTDLISFCMPFSFFLMQYRSLIGTVNLTVSIAFAVLCILVNKKTRLNGPFMAYTLFLVLRTAMTYFSVDTVIIGQFMNLIVQYLLCAVSVLIISQSIDIKKLYKSWSIVAVIVCAAVIWQSIQIYVFRRTVLPIKLLPFSDSAGWTTQSPRPVAFFTEPAVIVAILTPVIFLGILYKQLKFALFLSFCALLTSSTTAIVAVAVLWGTHIYTGGYSNKRKMQFTLLMVLASVVVMILPVFQTTTEKLLHEISGESSNAFGRAVSGWLVYQHLDLSSQIFGIPHYDISAYLHQHAEYHAYLSQIRTASGAAYFFNTAQRIFLTTGLSGAFLYLFMLFRVFKLMPVVYRPYLIYVIIIMFFASNFYMSNFFMMQFTVIFALINQGEHVFK